MLTLTGDNSYTGTTTINAGSTLQVGGDSALGSGDGSCTSDLEVDGTLDLNGYSPTVNALNGNGTITSSAVGLSSTLSVGDGDASGTFSGLLADGAAVALAQVGNGTLVLTGDNTYSGETTVSAGTLQVGDGGTTGSITGDVTDNGTLVFNRADAVAYGGNLSGSGNFIQEGPGSLTWTGAFQVGATVVQGGTLTFSPATGPVLNGANNLWTSTINSNGSTGTPVWRCWPGTPATPPATPSELP